MTELRSRFIAFLELKNYSKRTVSSYVQVVRKFSEFIGRSPEKLTQDDIRNYHLHLKRVKKLEPKTINLHLYAIKSFCQFMLPDTDIMRPFSRMREPNKQPKVISREEVEMLYQCDQCGCEMTLYNSCRNRNCPLCQSNARMVWVHDRINELLPVGYFHAVFTVSDLLNPFALRNKKVFYRIIFRAVKETLLTLSEDNKRLGATVGFVTVLHTWGQTLVDHPHIHVIIPGGGMTAGGKWKAFQKKFLFPVPVVRKMFRGKVMEYFTEAVKDGAIQFFMERCNISLIPQNTASSKITFTTRIGLFISNRHLLHRSRWSNIWDSILIALPYRIIVLSALRMVTSPSHGKTTVITINVNR